MVHAQPSPEQSASHRLGRYRLIATLGQGGMGTIHLAVAGGLGGFRKLFVVKELKAELTHNEDFLRLFMREARLAARLNHANVVHTVEADQDAGRCFLAMEFLDGQPFSEILRRAQLVPAVPLALRLQVVCHALAGLHHAHEIRDYDGTALQIVHRDVSPTNIFVTYDGEVKMLDFGIARAGEPDGTQPRGFKGKIGYAAPEHLRMQQGDRRSDVFAAGVVLWEAIALRHLVRGKPSTQVFEARVLGTEPRISQLLPELDPALSAICDRAMHIDPEQRYATAEALRLELQEFLKERGLLSDPMVLAELMRKKFAKERAHLHHLIEEQLASAEEVSHSFVAPRKPEWFSETPAGKSAAASGQHGYTLLSRVRVSKRVGMIGASLLAAAALGLRVQSDQGETRAVNASMAAPLPAPPSEGASAAEANLRAYKAENAARAAEASLRAHEQERASAASKEGAHAPAKALVVTKARSVQPAASKGVRSDASSAAPTDIQPSAAPPRPNLDLDLRSVQPAARRELDANNPFR